MRKRTNLSRSPSEIDEESGSDPEDCIQAIEPDDEDQPVFERSNNRNEAIHQTIWIPLKEGKAVWVQCVTIFMAAALTYSYRNVGGANVQIAIMTVITLVGASPFCSTHVILAGIGAFVGGQNIIGSTGRFESNTQVPPINYLWLLLLSSVVGCSFSLILRFRILDGYAGRLGTSTFVGMNLVMITVYGPVGVVDWDRYYYGLTHLINLAEEDSAIPLASAWKWTEEAELAIGYVFAVLWLGLIGGATRIYHHSYIQQCTTKNEEASRKAPMPLNNVLVPVLFALLSMLVVNATNYRHASGLYNGFAVGSYVAMASLQKIPSILQFAAVSLVAATWGLALTPFFVGFAGKSGFTSMLGHVTYTGLESFLDRFRARQRMQQESTERLQRQQEREEQEEREQQRELKLFHESSQVQTEDKIASPPSSPRNHTHGRKYVKPKEQLYTKQQRRQQQRLMSLQRQQQHKQQQHHEQESTQTTPLAHRAWSALPTTSDGMWQHPMGDPTTSKPKQLPHHDVV